MVIIKADGLPGWLVQRMLAERDSETGKSPLPWIEHVFVQQGIWARNFYSRGVSLSVPSWSILDTGHPMVIRGNVEYDRYTMRAFDYVNFVPFYFKFALSKTVDMPGVELLDDLGIPLLMDRFAFEQRHQSFQLFQRGIRWDTLKRAARGPFPLTAPRELLDEWQAGFQLSRSLQAEIERDLLRAVGDPRILYLDLFTGDFDHTVHLDNSEKTQRRILSEIDRLVGRLWTAIGKSPLASRTLLVLVSDHGLNTTPDAYSQGYNLVELLRSAAGGGHHVVTNRHPLAEYKLKGLYPFVHKVFTPSRATPYGEASAKEYPTALLDLDGNERAGIYLRNSDLNEIHLLLLQLERRDLAPPVRQAAVRACLDAIERYSERSRPRIELMRAQLEALRTAIVQTDSRIRQSDKGREVRRMKAHVSSWRTDEMAYRDALAALDRLAPSALDGRYDASKIVPKRVVGEPNTIHQLQNYVVGLSPAGLQVAPDGTLDRDGSFRRIDYFQLLSGLMVRNVVQDGVGNQPVDFVAVPVPVQALSSVLPVEDKPESAVWLHGGADRQLLVLGRRDPIKLRVVPVAQLRESANGAIQYIRPEWREGLPLELFEDQDFAVPAESRAAWLSEWHSERDWLRASHRTRYSNAVVGLFEHFRVGKAGEGFHWARRELVGADLLVLARDRWNFNVRSFNPGGNHGSFFRIATHGTLMLAGGASSGLPRGLAIDEPYDALSFVPTILALMGRCEPGLKGEVIQEAGAAACTPAAPETAP